VSGSGSVAASSDELGLGLAVGRTLGRALPVGGEFAVGLEVADDDTDGLLDEEGALVAVGDGVALAEGEAVSFDVGESVGAINRSREARAGL
jgi:hypothetical protein